MQKSGQYASPAPWFSVKSVKCFSLTFLFISVIFLYARITHASFEDTGIGARATGMGNAFVGDADDAYAIYYNPAGLVQLAYPEFSSYYGKLYMGLSDDSDLGQNFFAYAHPLRIKKKYMPDESGFIGMNDYGTVGVGYQQFELDDLYKETSISLSYARVFMPDVYLGLTVKSLKVGYGSDAYTENAINQTGMSRGGIDPVFSGGKDANGVGFDIGVLYEFMGHTRIGCVVANINQPSVALESSADKVDLAYKLGISREFKYGKMNTDLVREKRVAGSTDTNLLMGYEYWLDTAKLGELGMRIGYGEGSRGYRKMSMGFSYRVHIVQLDYGFSIPLKGIEDTLGSHRVGMTFRFGKEVKDDNLGALLEKEERLFLEAKEAMKKAVEEKKRLEFEIERMKAELEGLDTTELKAKEKEMKKVESRIDEVKAAYKEAFGIAVRFYNKKLLKGMGAAERAVILEKVIEKYRKVGVDVGGMEKELKKMKTELKSTQDDYDLAMRYYRLMVERGASAKERKDILDKLIKKYKSTGVDMRELRDELKKLDNGSQ